MKIKAKGKEKGGKSKRRELASGVKIKSKANYIIPAGIFSGFRGLFRCVVLYWRVLSRRCFLLRKTYFAALRLYSFADIRSEFIRCISG